MKITTNIINNVKIIETFKFEDFRGSFTKIISKGTLQNDFYNVDEFYYSTSKKDVIRGMHFQLPPFENYKLIYVIRGSIEDVLIDLRKESSTYLNISKICLNESNKLAILIPPGVAHGFKSLENNTTLLYFSNKVFSAPHDSGIHFNSIDYQWDVNNPIVSDKDKKLPSLQEFMKENPF